jgi:uncharacterized protein (DUF1330 family)
MSTYERLTPTDPQGAAFAQGPQNEPVVMVNLLRFRARAAYPREYQGPSPEVPGETAFRRYVEAAAARVSAIGGRLIWGGPALMTLVGPSNERWDEILVVVYPSRAAYRALSLDGDYQAALVHRQAALAETRLFACKYAPEAVSSPEPPAYETPAFPPHSTF